MVMPRLSGLRHPLPHRVLSNLIVGMVMPRLSGLRQDDVNPTEAAHPVLEW